MLAAGSALLLPLLFAAAPAGPTAPAAPLVPVVPVALPLAHPLAQFSSDATVRFHALLGTSNLNDDFAPADEHTIFGLGLTVHEQYTTLGFEAGFSYSRGDGEEGGIDFDSSLFELSFGPRWTFEPFGPDLRPYVAIGGSIVRAAQDASGVGPETDWELGVYARAGIEYEFAGGWSIGFDVRALEAGDASLLVDSNLEQVQAAVTIGWAW